MANHGAIAIGRTMKETLLCAKILEKASRAFIEAEFLGGAKSVNPLRQGSCMEVYLRKYSKRSIGEGK